MADWITPKTDWVSTDFFNIGDYNRIVGNLFYVKDLALTVFEQFDIHGMVEEKNYYSMFYASEMNTIEDNLDIINKHTFNLNIGESQEYAINGATPDFNEFNRIESATLRIFNAMYGQLAIMQHLEIQFQRTQLGKRTHYAKEEINDYRLGYRLGLDKGVLR